MATDRLAAAVDALAPPWEGHYYAALESTQDEARAAARLGAPDRSIYASDHQRSWRGRQRLAIVAVGVNINTRPADLAARPSPATSLAIACGQDVDRGELLKALIRRMNHWLEQPVPELFKSWQSRLWGRGQRLRLLDLGEEHEVIVLGAAPDGSLRIRLPDGAERTTTTGELIV